MILFRPRLATILAFLCLLNCPGRGQCDDGWIPLFNGQDTTGWTFTLRPPKDRPNEKPDPKETWSIKDGVLVCTGKPNGYIATDREYENYHLRLKWRYPKDAKIANSGVLLHVTGPDVVWPHSIEAQLNSGKAGDLWLNPDADKKLPTIKIDTELKDEANKDGRHYFRKKTEHSVEKELGEWNLYEIDCIGSGICLKINGILVAEATDCSLKKGRIALQSEGSSIEFKEIELKKEK
jgi:Domain of Unknown Function (DUF1080)